MTEPKRRDPIDEGRIELVRDRERPSEHGDGRLEEARLGCVEGREELHVRRSLLEDLLRVSVAGRLVLRDLSASTRTGAGDFADFPLVPRLVEAESLDILGGVEDVILLLGEGGEAMVDNSEISDRLLVLEKLDGGVEEGRTDPIWVVRP